MPDYFTIDEFRALPDVPLAKYSNAAVEAEAAHVVAVIEREVGAAFIQRTAEETHDGGSRAIFLAHPFARSAVSVTEGGTTVTGCIVAGGVLRKSDGAPWATGEQNIAVTYTHSYSLVPPADLKNVAMWATRARLLENRSTASVNSRQTSMSTDMGTIQFVVAGKDRPFGIPAIDEVVIGYKRRLDVFGFA